MFKKNILIFYADNPERIYAAMDNKYQVIYDRLSDRKFDNSKFKSVAGEMPFTAPEVGLERCLREFLREPTFRNVPVKAQAWMDKEMKEHTALNQFRGTTNKIKYLIGRYTPYFKIKREER